MKQQVNENKEMIQEQNYQEIAQSFYEDRKVKIERYTMHIVNTSNL